MIDDVYGKLLAIWALSAIFSCEAARHICKLATKVGFVHVPRAERWSSRRVAMGGGIPIIVGTIVMALAVLKGAGLGLAVAVLTVFFAGLLDDKYGLSPWAKLIVQILAATYLAWSGYRFSLAPRWLSVALSVFWMVGLSNAVNLLDNMDGIAAGVSSVALFALAALSGFSSGLGNHSVFAAAASGAAAGFLVLNFQPALMFMGDAGSLPLGLLMAACATGIRTPAGWPPVSSMFVAALVAGVPIFDTTLVCISRVRAGRRVSTGGKDHTTHRLICLGLSERRTALVLYLVCLALAALSWLVVARGVGVLIAAVAISAIAGGAAMWRLLGLRVYES